MAEQQLVVLFGDSLLMDAVDANLAHREDLSLVRIRTVIPDIVPRLYSLDPDLIVFDFDDVHSQFLLPMLRIKIGMSLIGLDSNFSTAIRLTSHQYLELTSDDLARVIHNYA